MLIDITMAVVALCLVVMLHELGHYLAAVASGMKVERFSVFGIGPAILRLGHIRGTEFVIGAFPFGAYVLIRGMEPQADDDEAPPPEPESFDFRDKPLWRRALVLAGGPIFNYLTAIVLFFVVFAAFGLKQPPHAIVIERFMPESAALAAGLAEGDVLVRIGDRDIDPLLQGADIAAGAEPFRGKTLPVVVRRGGALVEAVVHVPAEGLALGIESRALARREHVPLAAAARDAVVVPFVTSIEQLRQIGLLVTRQIEGRVSGPVDIVYQIAKSARRGLGDFIEMTALISTMLGLMNLLPVPALDGGRLVFLGYEAIRGRPANPRVEEAAHGIGIYLLLALLLVVTFKDVRNLSCSADPPESPAKQGP